MAGGAGRAVVLTNEEYQLGAAGATFAGRDIFAPAAAHLCNGIDLYDLLDKCPMLPPDVAALHSQNETVRATVVAPAGDPQAARAQASTVVPA